MNYLSNVHAHSTFSDGKNTPEEMVLRALELGYVSFGLSDHSDTPCDHSYCMKRENYAAYQKTLRDLRDRCADRIEVLCGLEKDRESDLDPEEWDYLIGSVHYLAVKSGERIPVDESARSQSDSIRFFFGGDRMEFVRRYFDAVTDHAVRGGFQILGHFDLITKFGVFDDLGDAYRKIALDALDACLDAVPYIEVNVGGVTRGFRTDPYPAPFLLERIRERGGKVVLTGDTHRASMLDVGFNEALSLLRSLGFTEVFRLRDKGFESVPV